MNQPPLRILYIAGPGDVIATYRHWREGRDDPSQVAVTYSGQFYDACRELGAVAWVVGSHPDRRELRDGPIRIEHRPIPLEHRRGLLYHLGATWYSLSLLASAVRFRADVVVATGGVYWFMLRILPRLGIHVVPSLHCTLWTTHRRTRASHRFQLLLSRGLFKRDALATLAVSDNVAAQVRELTAGRHRPLLRFDPVYRQGAFADLPEPDPRRRPFRVLFAGRVEWYKGVFNLLDVARDLNRSGRHDIVFDVCGRGAALDELSERIDQFGLGGRFICHGPCDQATMKRMFAACHAVIVPTTSHFIEGCNKAAIEGVLAGRPVITSTVCGSTQDLGDAVELVDPDDVAGYRRAVLRLCDDHTLYERRRRACRAAHERFYDLSESWGAKLRQVLRMIRPELERSVPHADDMPDLADAHQSIA